MSVPLLLSFFAPTMDLPLVSYQYWLFSMLHWKEDRGTHNISCCTHGDKTFEVIEEWNDFVVVVGANSFIISVNIEGGSVSCCFDGLDSMICYMGATSHIIFCTHGNKIIEAMGDWELFSLSLTTLTLLSGASLLRGAAWEIKKAFLSMSIQWSYVLLNINQNR